MTAAAQIAIVDCGSSKVSDIAQRLDDLGAAQRVILPGQLNAIASELPAAIIISGSPALIKDAEPTFLADFESLRTLKVPILGICFGHQIIGMLYGAEVTMGKEDRGQRRLQILQRHSLFNGLSDDDLFQQDHIEEVSLPGNFIHLATSSHCHNEAMMHRDLPLFGVQFHPESSAESGRQLLANFLAIAANEAATA